ncbi:putative 6.8 kDa protein in trnL 3'region [Bienertia sinuspersici]
MEYITKVECLSISMDRSYRPGSDIQLLRFELSGGYLILIYISKRWTIKPIFRFNRSLKREIGSQKTRDVKAGPISLISNPRWNGTTRGSICKHSIYFDTLE